MVLQVKLDELQNSFPEKIITYTEQTLKDTHTEAKYCTCYKK